MVIIIEMYPMYLIGKINNIKIEKNPENFLRIFFYFLSTLYFLSRPLTTDAYALFCLS